jgi:hypothetical protein
VSSSLVKETQQKMANHFGRVGAKPGVQCKEYVVVVFILPLAVESEQSEHTAHMQNISLFWE